MPVEPVESADSLGRPAELSPHELVCPFHAATVNPDHAALAGAPPPAEPGRRNSLTLLYGHARYHLGADPGLSVCLMLVGALVARDVQTGGPRGVTRWASTGRIE